MRKLEQQAVLRRDAQADALHRRRASGDVSDDAAGLTVDDLADRAASRTSSD
jgi:hypothetical protein